MDKNAFWKLLDGLDPEDAAAGLAARLEELEPAEVAEFQRHFDEAHERAYTWPLWGAAFLIEGGCSDDSFVGFRYGLISRGRKVYESALADPDTLADLLDEEDFLSNEEFGYVAGQVYEELTGDEIPHSDEPPALEPTGEEWDFDDMDLNAEKLPKLTARFGD
jgi:hypothetical protein